MNDAGVVPVGEGQWDVDLAGEVAHSFWPRPFYVSGRAGYRIRSPNEESGIDFGNEVFWLVSGRNWPAGPIVSPKVTKAF